MFRFIFTIAMLFLLARFAFVSSFAAGIICSFAFSAIYHYTRCYFWPEKVRAEYFKSILELDARIAKRKAASTQTEDVSDEERTYE